MMVVATDIRQVVANRITPVWGAAGTREVHKLFAKSRCDDGGSEVLVSKHVRLVGAPAVRRKQEPVRSTLQSELYPRGGEPGGKPEREEGVHTR